MTDYEAVNRFKQNVQRAFSQKNEKIEFQLDFDKKYQRLFSKEYAEIIIVINSAKNSDTLSVLMDAYLKLYFNYYANKNNINFYRSDQTFKELILKSTRVTKKTVDLYDRWYDLILGDSRDLSNNMKKRYNELNKTVKSEVEAFLGERERNKKANKNEDRRAHKSIIDILKDEFLKQSDPNVRLQSNTQLYDFDPHPQQYLKLELYNQIYMIKEYWKRADQYYSPTNVGLFAAVLDVYRHFLVRTSNEGAPQLFQVIKHFQDLFRSGREPMKEKGQTRIIEGEKSELMYELYAMALVQLLVFANARLQLQRNRTGFTAEEKLYFLNPIAVNNYPYFSNIAIRFDAEPKNIEILYDGSKIFLNLILMTRHQLKNFELATMKKTLEIVRKWKAVMDLTEQLKNEEKNGLAAQAKLLQNPKNMHTIETFYEMSTSKVDLTRDGPDLSKGMITIGDWPPGAPTVHGKARIVYIDPEDNNRIFVELESLKPTLFIVDKGYLKDTLYGSRINDIYNSTVGVLEIIELYMLAIGFMPALVEGGIGGLITEVIIYCAGSKIEDVVSEVNPKLGKLLGFLFQVLAPRPSFGPKLRAELPVSTPKNINTIIILDGAHADSRSLADILIADEKAERLASKPSESSTSRARETLTNIKAKTTEALTDISEYIKPATEVDVGSELAAETGGSSFRVRSDDMGSSGTGRGSRSIDRPVKRLSDRVRRKNDKTLNLLDEYSDYLVPNDAHVLQQETRSILSKVDRGILNEKDAAQKLTNLLNRAKEKTGEYVADSAVYGNFEVKGEVRIPRRNNGVPVLDKVYKIKNPQTGEIEHLLVEVKGGESTKLGKVTDKTYTEVDGSLKFKVNKNQMVEQASPKWYYQKIIEIYETGKEELALDLFKAAKSGKVKSAIIKSGIKMDPYVWLDEKEIVAWFRNKELPYKPK